MKYMPVTDSSLIAEFNAQHSEEEAGETDKAAFERALREPLGLELVPTNTPVKILVVEKTK